MASREERLGRTFVELADTLVDDFDLVDLLVRVSERCVERWTRPPPGCSWPTVAGACT